MDFIERTTRSTLPSSGTELEPMICDWKQPAQRRFVASTCGLLGLQRRFASGVCDARFRLSAARSAACARSGIAQIRSFARR